MDSLTERLFGLVDALQGTGRRTVAELAAQLEVSERTVRRDVVRLQALDVAIETVPGRGGGVELAPGALLLPLRFSDAEVLALGVGLELVRRSGEPVDPAVIGSARRRLDSALTPRLQRRLGALLSTLANGPSVGAPTGSDTRPHAERSSLILDLAEASEGRFAVRLGYRDRQGSVSERTVEPHGLVRLAPHWYLAGHCHLRDDIRVFRLDRVRFVRPLEERFVRPPDADPSAAVARALAHPIHPDTVRIELLLHTDLERVSDLDLPLAAHLEREGGSVRMTVPARPASLPRIALHLLALPFEATVLAPDELRDALERLAARASDMAQPPEGVAT